jgi:hypothetical protein
MLNIKFGFLENRISNPSAYFDVTFDKTWFDDSLVKAMVLDVDKSEVISANNIISSVLGGINCKGLSGGVKNLILAYKQDRPIDASYCGDNCAKWLLEIGKLKDLNVELHHIMVFPDSMKATILNSGHEVSSYKEYLYEAVDYLQPLDYEKDCPSDEDKSTDLQELENMIFETWDED